MSKARGSLEGAAQKKLAQEKREAVSPLVVAKFPKPRNAAGRVARDNNLIVDRVVNERSWPYLAVKYAMTERSCQKIVKAWRDQQPGQTLTDLDPLGEVTEMVRGYEAQLERYREYIEMALAEKNLNAIAAFEKGIRDTRIAKAEILQASNILPKNLGVLKVEYELRIMARRFIDVLNKHDAPDALRDDVLDVLATLRPRQG